MRTIVDLLQRDDALAGQTLLCLVVQQKGFRLDGAVLGGRGSHCLVMRHGIHD